jgi:hypothetical protein
MFGKKWVMVTYAVSVSLFWQGLYADGVESQSPGSRRGEAAERTLGYASHNTRVRRRRYTTGTWLRRVVIVSALDCRCRHLCNAFGVWDVWGV